MNSLFYGCDSLESLPDLSKWNTYNLIDIGDIFNECKLLKTLPDISKWNTSKVIIMNNVFYNCSSLTKIPDISKWDTQNVEDLSNFFYGCSSLKSISDISNWITKNVYLMNGLFYDCTSLVSLPEISKWDVSNVISMNVMFYGCKNIKYLPDISKWNTKNVKTMNMMFFICFSLQSLPDIFNKWDISNITSMNSMFYRCHSLDQLPRVDIWIDKKKGIDLSFIIFGCSPSLFINDVEKWTESNIKIMIEDSKNNDIIFEYEMVDNNVYSLKNKQKYIRYFNINKEYILCKNCLKFPLIKMNSFDSLNIKCDCLEINNETPQYIIENYVISKENDDFIDKISSHFYCKVHIKKFKYYCLNCQKDYCRECLRTTSEHSSHEIFYFASYIYKINLKIYNIKNIFYRKHDKNHNANIERIIGIICNNYYKYYNHNFIQTIENFYSYFFSQRIEINLIKELKEEKDLSKISTIIICFQNFNNLNILCNKDLMNVELLTVMGNCIEDISPLVNVNFKNLKILNLENNHIGDNNIQYIEKFDFKNLLEFILYSNHLTDFEFFNTINNFPKLKKLYIGKNNFNKNKLNNKCNINYKLNQLEEIGLSDEVFSDNSINRLSTFKFDILKIIHLNRSNLTSLDFVNYLESQNLEEIWLSDNKIEEFMPLIKYKNLKKIEINSNKIKNISNLIEFIGNFSQLEKINMKYNSIDLNDLNNIKIINSIKTEGKVKLFITTF